MTVHLSILIAFWLLWFARPIRNGVPIVVAWAVASVPLLPILWNYRVVHVHGRLRIRDDEKFVRGVVARLTRVHEAGTGDARPWKMTDSAPEHINQLLTMIVGIEIEITKMVGKWKLSQNKDARDRSNAADELRKRGEQEISTAMQATVTGKPD